MVKSWNHGMHCMSGYILVAVIGGENEHFFVEFEIFVLYDIIAQTEHVLRSYDIPCQI